jgi:hypothetical protein
MAVVADLSAVIERASVDLALSEDPAGFLAVLENAGEVGGAVGGAVGAPRDPA